MEIAGRSGFRDHDGSNRSSVRVWLLGPLAGCCLAGLLSGASWLALGHGTPRAAGIVQITIPPGTEAQIRSGGPDLVSTATYNLVAGDRLHVVNADAVAHEVAGLAVQPAAAEDIVFRTTGQQRLVCSFHAGGVLDVNVQGARSPLVLLLPTLLLGLPLGFALSLSWTVLRTLDASG
jgi:hypothetical protein